MVPVGVTFDPIAQAEWGLSGHSITSPELSFIAIVTFGFLWSQGNWASCNDSVSTIWTSCD